jgi:hypothetical protein
MKTLKSALCLTLLLAAAGSTRSDVSAQKNGLPPGLNEDSTVREILEYLDETSFPHARIGLEIYRPGSDESIYPEEGRIPPIVSAVFSAGFRLASEADDCHLRLMNDDVRLYDEESKDLRPLDLSGVTDTEPPYAAEFSAWLETASHDRGKAPFLHTKDSERAKLLGAWRTEFESRGFFVRDIFGVKMPAVTRGSIGKHHSTNGTVAFIFDDRQAGERFDAAFRRLIKLCQPRSQKPRWSR